VGISFVNPARNTSKISPVAHQVVDALRRPTPRHGTHTCAVSVGAISENRLAADQRWCRQPGRSPVPGPGDRSAVLGTRSPGTLVSCDALPLPCCCLEREDPSDSGAQIGPGHVSSLQGVRLPASGGVTAEDLASSTGAALRSFVHRRWSGPPQAAAGRISSCGARTRRWKMSRRHGVEAPP
jgi:hypothetical protein